MAKLAPLIFILIATRPQFPFIGYTPFKRNVQLESCMETTWIAIKEIKIFETVECFSNWGDIAGLAGVYDAGDF
ncbi:hypothetical protein ASL11_09030 [Paenibacillus sp. Soil750]|nr:hypothetical protein ASL11_09030 [Paenibacillus sp. Soil750]